MLDLLRSARSRRRSKKVHLAPKFAIFVSSPRVIVSSNISAQSSPAALWASTAAFRDLAIPRQSQRHAVQLIVPRTLLQSQYHRAASLLNGREIVVRRSRITTGHLERRDLHAYSSDIATARSPSIAWVASSSALLSPYRPLQALSWKVLMPGKEAAPLDAPRDQVGSQNLAIADPHTC
jgi:hypothetical protein